MRLSFHVTIDINLILRFSIHVINDHSVNFMLLWSKQYYQTYDPTWIRVLHTSIQPIEFNVSVPVFFCNIGKTLLHEWVHQRYGVFDEDGVDSCIAFEGGYIFPRRCSRHLQGDVILSPDGRKCSFNPWKQQSTGVSSSVMYRPGYDHVSASLSTKLPAYISNWLKTANNIPS